MDVVNCKRCKKIFRKVNSPYCDACQKEEEKVFKAVKDYLYDHPNQDIQQIAKDTGVPVSKLLEYIKEGRFAAGS